MLSDPAFMAFRYYIMGRTIECEDMESFLPVTLKAQMVPFKEIMALRKEEVDKSIVRVRKSQSDVIKKPYRGADLSNPHNNFFISAAAIEQVLHLWNLSLKNLGMNHDIGASSFRTNDTAEGLLLYPIAKTILADHPGVFNNFDTFKEFYQRVISLYYRNEDREKVCLELERLSLSSLNETPLSINEDFRATFNEKAPIKKCMSCHNPIHREVFQLVKNAPDIPYGNPAKLKLILKDPRRGDAFYDKTMKHIKGELTPQMPLRFAPLDQEEREAIQAYLDFLKDS